MPGSIEKKKPQSLRKIGVQEVLCSRDILRVRNGGQVVLSTMAGFTLHHSVDGTKCKNFFCLSLRFHRFAIDEGTFLCDENFVEQPLRIAVQYFCNLRSQVITGLTEAIDDLAEVCFVNSQDLRHAILAKATRVDFQFQIRIDIALNCHLMTQ